MTNVLLYARDWVTFGTVWEPELDDKISLARWCAGYDTRFAYVMWDTDNAAQVAGSTASAGYQIAKVLELDGTVPVFNTPELAAWVMGTAASINFEETNGRLTFAFKQGGHFPSGAPLVPCGAQGKRPCRGREEPPGEARFRLASVRMSVCRPVCWKGP